MSYVIGLDIGTSGCKAGVVNEKGLRFQDEFVRHIRFEKELVIKIDGKSNKGVVLKPVASNQSPEASRQ